MNIPILQQLQKLKEAHASSKVNSAAFQPDEKHQKALIFKNDQKREEAKRLMEAKLREADEKQKETDVLKNQLSSSSQGRTEAAERPQTAPMGGGAATVGRSKSFKFSVNDGIRPKTSGSVLGGGHVPFDSVLKSSSVEGQFSKELKTQVEHQAQDSKRIFDALLHHFKGGGVGCQFSAKRDFEVIDVTAIAASSNVRPLTGNLRLEDMNNMKKKDGIALLFDPCTDTGSAEVTVRIHFQKALDLVTFENCSRDYTFCGDGNYFGLQLVDEQALSRWAAASKASGIASSGATSPNVLLTPAGDLSPAAPSSPQGSPGREDAARKGLSSARGLSEALSRGGSSASSGVIRSEHGGRRRASLPGWEGRPPLFVPSQRCSLEIVSAASGAGAAVAYNLSRLRVFAVVAASPRAAIRKLHEFCSSFFVTHTANLVVTGGISALNLAALHGNLEVCYRRSFIARGVYH
jgi:hypothetical protein